MMIAAICFLFCLYFIIDTPEAIATARSLPSICFFLFAVMSDLATVISI